METAHPGMIGGGWRGQAGGRKTKNPAFRRRQRCPTGMVSRRRPADSICACERAHANRGGPRPDPRHPQGGAPIRAGRSCRELPRLPQTTGPRGRSLSAGTARSPLLWWTGGSGGCSAWALPAADGWAASGAAAEKTNGWPPGFAPPSPRTSPAYSSGIFCHLSFLASFLERAYVVLCLL
jgi:hypothetical protein